jgi:hypothetical protein
MILGLSLGKHQLRSIDRFVESPTAPRRPEHSILLVFGGKFSLLGDSTGIIPGRRGDGERHRERANPNGRGAPLTLLHD